MDIVTASSLCEELASIVSRKLEHLLIILNFTGVEVNMLERVKNSLQQQRRANMQIIGILG